MKLNVKAMALSIGLLWAVMILFVGAVATVRGPQDGSLYGKEFLLLVASIYPGYDGAPGFGSTIVGALYGFVDGAIGGALIAWLYNLFAGKAPAKAA
ncbi:MAG: hypothetical protein ACF8XB_04380 [Planctomycetota bacterium JB042]